MLKRFSVILILILAFCGLADSAYLTQHVESGTPLICNIQSLSGCNVVADSQYSRVFGIPLAAVGLFFYVLVFIAAALEWLLVNRALRRLLQALAIIGLLFSLYSTVLQVFFIHAYCIYCLASAVITLFMFVCATLIEPMRSKVAPTVLPTLLMPPHA